MGSLKGATKSADCKTKLISVHQQEAASIDNDIRTKYSQYNQVKNTLATLQRKQTCVIRILLRLSHSPVSLSLQELIPS